MSDVRADAAAHEAEAWAVFETALAPIPRERWIEEGVLPGWSVNDLLWHVAGWIGRCADRLETVRAGGSVHEESDEEAEELNARFAEQARGMEADAVRSGLDAARRRLREAWATLPEADDRALEWFGGETYEHYEEHIPDLERFAG